MAETTLRHRYRLRSGGEARHVHRIGAESPAERRGRLIRKFLNASDITQLQVATEAGVSPEHLNRVLHGRYPVTAELAQALSRLTNTWPALFLTSRSTPE